MKAHHSLTFGCLASVGVISVVLLNLSACADPARGWMRVGGTAAMRDADFADCHDLARSTSEAGVDQDIRSSTASRASFVAAPAAPVDLSASAARLETGALLACMAGKGYHRG